MPPSTKVTKKSTSIRNRSRLKTSSHIRLLGSIALVPCYRCFENNLLCIRMEENRCAECVATHNEERCDVEGPSRLVREYVIKEKELFDELEKAAAIQTKIARLSKVLKSLKSRAKEETEAMIKELEDEKRVADGGNDPPASSVDESMEWFDRFQQEIAENPIEPLPGSADETS